VRTRLVSLAVVGAIVVAAGCGTGERERDERSERPRAATTTVAEEPSLAAKAPTKAEVAWVGRLVDWSLALAEPLEVGAAAGDALSRGERLAAADVAAAEEALAEVLACRRTYERIAGAPPSGRLDGVATAVQDACESFEAGAEAGLRVLGGASEPNLADEWARAWERGSRLAATAADAVVDYQPSNARRLAVKKGRVGVTRIEPVFSDVASSVAETDVETRCWSRKDWPRLIREMKAFSNGRVREGTLGFAGYGDRRVNLAPPVCEALVGLRYERLRPPAGEVQLALALSVGTLAHEAQHARGIANEARAECYGMQRVRDVARELGADLRYAAALAALYLRVVYPQAPRVYRSPECRDGGRLDLDAKTSRWP
jgi:hypothetical protein